ncbi:MAG: PIN domain-containing protein [Verrucomicrobiales bacterium]|nr:PIN domain-containing protein [Verrucomicrobiales bacterium]
MKSPTSWSLSVVRAVFFALSVFTGITIAMGTMEPAWVGALSGAAFMGMLLALDRVFARFTIREFSHATFGLLIGLFCAWLVNRVGILQLSWIQSRAEGEALAQIIEICIYGTLAFFGITFALRSERDQFALVIPYVRFRRVHSEGEPVLLDTNVIIDGRVEAVLKTGFLSGPLVVPRHVLEELQRLCDSRDPIKSERGRHGLEQVRALRELPEIEVVVHEAPLQSEPPQTDVDAQLVSIARELNARLLTNDENLTRVARLRGVSVLNFNELAGALRPHLRPGDELSLPLVRPGKDRDQAVGYLSDGTMIVVNHAATHLGETVTVVISSTLPTSAGRLHFAELKKPSGTSS